MKRTLYEFDATLERVVDADTLDLSFDLGFGVHLARRIRLVGPDGEYVDAFETRGQERERGLIAKAYVTSKLVDLKPDLLVRTTLESGKYGRVLASVNVAPRGGPGWDLAEALHDHGYLRRYGDVVYDLDSPYTPLTT